jgi:hypothetical protein
VAGGSALLDGDWTDSVSSFASGNGTAGGNFAFRFNVLPGDVNNDGAVNTTDGTLIRNNPSPPGAYQAQRDVNGDGVVNTTDFNLVRAKIGTAGAALPTAEPGGSPMPLLAEPALRPLHGVGTLTDAELAPIVTAALTRWSAAGLTAQQFAALRNITFSVADLPGWYLGEEEPGQITIDANAAGYGWFIDPTPLDDVEFVRAIASTHLSAARSSGAAGHIDLLTTVMHEMGHALGLADSSVPEDHDNLMDWVLAVGERRLPNHSAIAVPLEASTGLTERSDAAFLADEVFALWPETPQRRGASMNAQRDALLVEWLGVMESSKKHNYLPL